MFEQSLPMSKGRATLYGPLQLFDDDDCENQQAKMVGEDDGDDSDVEDGEIDNNNNNIYNAQIS